MPQSTNPILGAPRELLIPDARPDAHPRARSFTHNEPRRAVDGLHPGSAGALAGPSTLFATRAGP
ncbi:MAG: hypothetical protein EB020_10655 [Proteobacteria bacterium]|nr:hypothetical protein [Pseudomonadota bacterium]